MEIGVVTREVIYGGKADPVMSDDVRMVQEAEDRGFVEKFLDVFLNQSTGVRNRERWHSQFKSGAMVFSVQMRGDQNELAAPGLYPARTAT